MSETQNVDGDGEGENRETKMTRVDPTERDVVTMEVTVDVSDCSGREKAMLGALASLYEDAFYEVVTKNRDYGWSFLNTGAKLAQSDGTPFDNHVRSQAYGLLTRSGDKRERLIENVFGEGDATVSDEPHMTAKEAGNYLFFLSFILKHPELAQPFE